jgi:hypothetical protein
MPDAIDPYIFYDYRAWQEVATVEACLLLICCAVIATLLLKRSKHG